MRKFFIVLILGVFSLGNAQAATFNFTGVNSDEADLSFQLSVDVTDNGGNAQFVFRNDGNGGVVDSFIGSVYFDSLHFTGLVSLSGTPGVNFKVGNGSGNFPEGNTLTPPFVTDFFFTKNGAAANGVNNTPPGEALTIVMSLGGSFQALIEGMALGDVVVGLHMQGYQTGGSDSYVNHSLPEPSTLILLLSSAGLFIGAAPFVKKS